MAQQITFQRFYNAQGNASAMLTFDGRQTLDGGYVTTGIGTFSGTERPFIQKFDCNGMMQWAYGLAASAAPNNIYGKVIQLPTDSHFVVLSNLGSFQSYNILVSRFDAQGNVIWKKVFNSGMGNDFGQSIRHTKDGGFIVCGGTNSYGTESVGSSYSDMYFIKLNADGTVAWAKTYGNVNGNDEARDIIELKGGGYAFTGSVLNEGCFKMAQGRLDSAGNLQYLKVYGDTLSRNNGYALVQDANEDLIIFGTTTMRAPIPNFNGDVDHWLIKTNVNGDTIWTRAFNGTGADGSDNSLSICLDSANNIILGTETMSYANTGGFTPNKQVIHKVSNSGNLLLSRRYNVTGSQYTRVHNALDGGYTLCGFTTIGVNTTFRTNMYKLNANLESGCYDVDVTAFTDFGHAPCKQLNAPFTADTGVVTGNSSFQINYTTVDTTLCSYYPWPDTTLQVPDTVCVGEVFTVISAAGAQQYLLDWGNGDDTVLNQNQVNYLYNQQGTYQIKYTIIKFCAIATVIRTIVVVSAPTLSLVSSETIPAANKPLTLTANSNATSLFWSNGATGTSISVSDSGWYKVQATNSSGCNAYDSIYVSFKPSTEGEGGTIFIPNAFSPNADGDNDLLKYFVTGDFELVSFRVYNRWGTVVFDTKNPNEYWNGTFKGLPLDQGTFFVVAQFTNKGKLYTKSQDIILLR